MLELPPSLLISPQQPQTKRAQACPPLDRQDTELSWNPRGKKKPGTAKWTLMLRVWCVCARVCLCVLDLEQCTHTNCTVCIKCEHVCIHMYKLIFYTRYCNRFVMYMQWVSFISIVSSGVCFLAPSVLTTTSLQELDVKTNNPS